MGQKNMIKEKTLPRKKKLTRAKKAQKKNKMMLTHEGDGFIPSMKS
jgi:hypothetical protein